MSVPVCPNRAWVLSGLLGSNFTTVVQKLSMLVPYICEMLHHLHTSIHDGRRAIDFPDVQADMRKRPATAPCAEII